MVDIHSHVHCTLLYAESRVTPHKPVTIARLKLQGAVVAIRLATTLIQELRMSIDQEYVMYMYMYMYRV